MIGIKQKIEKMKSLQSKVLDFLDDENDKEEHFQVLCNFIKEQKIHKKNQEFELFLNLLVKISNNHHRTDNFFEKIESILIKYKEKIIDYYDNIDIFEIFKSNKRLLLFLFNEDIIIIDDYIFDKMRTDKYRQMKYREYFTPEIKKFAKKKKKDLNKIIGMLKKIPQDFNQKRRKGENDDFLCELIRNDSIEEFIVYVNTKNYPLNSKIKVSVYETNPVLMKDEINLIKYAAFYGSVQIFKYLIGNNAEVSTKACCLAVYSDNSEMINCIEEYLIDKSLCYSVFLEAVKCNNNDVANFILKNYDNIISKQIDLKSTLQYCLKYHNYLFYPNNIKIEDSLLYFCKFDYLPLIKLFFSESNIHIEEIKISKLIIYDIMKLKKFNQIH